MKVHLPDGTTANFPEGTPPEDMTKAIQSYLMKTAVDTGEKQAVAGAEQRGKQGETFYGGRGDMGELVTPEFAKTQAIVGATIPAAVATGASFAAAPFATAASLVAGHEGSKIGGSVARAVGAPPMAGEMVGALAGGISPGLIVRKSIPALLASQLGRSAVAAETAPAAEAAGSIAKTLIESGWTKEAASKAAQNAVARMASEAAPSVAKAAATTPAQFNPESLQIIAKLRQLAQTSGANKIEITQAAQQAFPESWKEVMKMIMAPRTRI